jgi:hypothetical protein
VWLGNRLGGSLHAIGLSSGPGLGSRRTHPCPDVRVRFDGARIKPGQATRSTVPPFNKTRDRHPTGAVLKPLSAHAYTLRRRCRHRRRRTMSSTPHPSRRNTVSVTELRRVLANADAALAASTHHHASSHARTIPTAAQAFAPAPTSPTRSPTSSPTSSPFGSPSQSPVAQLPAPFDVRAAAETCRRKTGYVSFMDVDGLGAPAGAACDDDVDGPPPPGLRERSWSWSQLLGLAPGTVIGPVKSRPRDAPPPSAYSKRL